MEQHHLRAPTRARVRTRRPGRLRSATVVLGAIAALSAGALAARAAPATTAQPAAVAAAAPGCPTGTLPFQANLTGGSVQVGWLLGAQGVSATACGVLDATAGSAMQASVPKSSIGAISVPFKWLGLLDFPGSLEATTDLTGPVTIDAAGYHVTLRGSFLVRANIFGSDCSPGVITLGLTTESSGPVTGAPMKDDGSGTGTLKGRLVAGDFAVPAIQVSPTCNDFIAAIANFFDGLPLASGNSTAAFDVSLKLGGSTTPTTPTTGPATTTTAPATTTTIHAHDH